MARVLNAAKQDPCVIRWLHALDPERNVSGDLLRSSVRYSTTLKADCKSAPGIPRETASLLIPMYVRRPFLLGKLYGPMSPNVLALAVLRNKMPPPRPRSRRFVVDLSTSNPVEFVEYEWMMDGQLCVSMHEIDECGMYSGQTIIFEGPLGEGSPVPSRVTMRLHYQEVGIPGRSKQLPPDWREKPSSWETWTHHFCMLRSGSTRVRTTYVVSAPEGREGKQKFGTVEAGLDEECAIGEVGNSNSVANKIARMFLQMNGMMVNHPSQDEPVVRAADQRMMTNVAAHLYNEEEPKVHSPPPNATVLEPQIIGDPAEHNSDFQAAQPQSNRTLHIGGTNSQLSLLNAPDAKRELSFAPEPPRIFPLTGRGAVAQGSAPSLSVLGSLHQSLPQSHSYSERLDSFGDSAKLPPTFSIPERRQHVFRNPTRSLSSKAPSSLNSVRALEPLLDAIDEGTSPSFPVKRKEPAEGTSSFASRSEGSDSRMDVNTFLASKQLPDDAPLGSPSFNPPQHTVPVAEKTLDQPPLSPNSKSSNDTIRTSIQPTAAHVAQKCTLPPVQVPMSIYSPVPNDHAAGKSFPAPLFPRKKTPPKRVAPVSYGGTAYNSAVPVPARTQSPPLRNGYATNGSVAQSSAIHMLPQQQSSPPLQNTYAPSGGTSQSCSLPLPPRPSPRSQTPYALKGNQSQDSTLPVSTAGPTPPSQAPYASGKTSTQDSVMQVPTSLETSPSKATNVPNGIGARNSVHPVAKNTTTAGPSTCAAEVKCIPVPGPSSNEAEQANTSSDPDKETVWKGGVAGGIEKLQSRKDGAGREHVCRECGMRFSHKGHFNQHVRAVHEKIRKYKCETCNKAFAKRGDLLRHQFSQHDVGARFPCSKCSLSFDSKDELVVHFADVHDEDKPFKCAHCAKRYSTRSGLRKHVNAKHPDEPVPVANGSAATNGVRAR